MFPYRKTEFKVHHYVLYQDNSQCYTAVHHINVIVYFTPSNEMKKQKDISNSLSQPLTLQ
jgi:hypothetical protein